MIASDAALSAARLLDPLLDLLVVAAVMLLLGGRKRTPAGARAWPRRARYAGWLVWGALWILATPRVSLWALGRMEEPAIDVAAALGDTPEDRCVMVVLSGGTAQPRPGVTRAELLSGSSLPRAIGAARVYHERPVGHVIVSGRASAWSVPDETAAAMGDVMIALGVPKERLIIEPLARNTRENALFSSMLVRALGAEKTVLVTSALHMPRAALELERVGQPVIRAPVDHRYEPPSGVAPYVPSTEALARSGSVLHEILGRFKP